MKKFALACILLAIAAPAHAKIEKASWGESPDRQKVEIFTLTNARGASAQISTYGATLVSLKVTKENLKGPLAPGVSSSAPVDP